MQVSKTQFKRIRCFFALVFLLRMLPGSAQQDTTYYDDQYEVIQFPVLARYMEIKKCAVDDENKCAVSLFTMDSNRILFNWRYSDYESGILNGRCSRWYRSGVLHEEIMFEEGVKHGTERSFYATGQLKKLLRWEKGELVSGSFYLEDGSPNPNVYKEDLEEHEDMTDPTFPGGQEKMYLYLANNVDYPEQAKEEGWMGQVILSFVVGKKGEITDVKPVQFTHEIFYDAVAKAIKNMPRWEPGRVSGIPVRVRYSFPFKFKLE